jgi:hypothetical protein
MTDSMGRDLTSARRNAEENGVIREIAACADDRVQLFGLARLNAARVCCDGYGRRRRLRLSRSKKECAGYERG